ncbi:DoxX family protein [Flammeovirga agarivorans]|uniref:DoxX family membrane protein n=1 Tax=Flammeovirga agarivorans TaxID=2726742 RepID=A0A7X8SPK2_9BACT|nr:hypothetical protein [Flammeovirga agarivorans]NLR93983.1 hypothetical protein [Flammeovirga agarivorans]
MKQVKTSTVQNIFRVLLGLAMLYAGIGHLTFRRIAFQAQVPTWLTTDEAFVDFVVLASGVVEILFGALMVWGRNVKVQIGITLAIFYILIFPGNINQYINHIDSFGLNTDTKRFVRLLFQPVLVLWALWSSGGLQYLKERKNSN